MKVEYFEKKSNNQASHIIGAPLYVLHKKNIWNPHWEKVGASAKILKESIPFAEH
eukprot:UN18678